MNNGYTFHNDFGARVLSLAPISYYIIVVMYRGRNPRNLVIAAAAALGLRMSKATRSRDYNLVSQCGARIAKFTCYSPSSDSRIRFHLVTMLRIAKGDLKPRRDGLEKRSLLFSAELVKHNLKTYFEVRIQNVIYFH